MLDDCGEFGEYKFTVSQWAVQEYCAVTKCKVKIYHIQHLILHSYSGSLPSVYVLNHAAAALLQPACRTAGLHLPSYKGVQRTINLFVSQTSREN